MPSFRASSQPRDWTTSFMHCQVGSLPLAPHGKPPRKRWQEAKIVIIKIQIKKISDKLSPSNKCTYSFLSWASLVAQRTYPQCERPGLGRSGNGNPLQYSCWRTPWTEEPGGVQSMGSQRLRHDWATKRSRAPKLLSQESLKDNF